MDERGGELGREGQTDSENGIVGWDEQEDGLGRPLGKDQEKTAANDGQTRKRR